MVKDKTKYSTASKKRMLSMPVKERSELMRLRGQQRQEAMSEGQRKAHAKKMVTAREAKRHGSK